MGDPGLTGRLVKLAGFIATISISASPDVRASFGIFKERPPGRQFSDMRVHRITRDVTGDAYERLLEAALEEAGTFSLVWREGVQFDPSAAAVRRALRGLQLRHVKRDRWPGTILTDACATVVTYRVASEALPTLLEPGSLFAWRSPVYPEDLSFSTAAGAVCLATVSHEAMGWVLSDSLAAAIGKAVTLVPETLNARDEQYFKEDGS